MTIFSKIIAGQIPATFLYRDELVVAFLDIRPVNPGHTLVVPVKAVARLHELDDETTARMMQVAKKISRALRASALRCEDVTFAIADGEHAGQEVPHVHLHVIPRHTADGFGYRYPPGYGAVAERAALQEVAQGLRSHIEQ